jgi:DNA-binding ferritin-like protein
MCSIALSTYSIIATGANQDMSKYTYIRKHKLNGKKTDITEEVNGIMNINEYLLATVPKMTKLIDEIHDTITSGNLTDQDMVYELKRLFKEFEKQQV